MLYEVITQIDAQIPQVAVVDANDLGAQFDGTLEFSLGTDLGEHAHLQGCGYCGQLTVLLVIQHRQHQQYRIGLMMARQVDLVGIDDEVLAQHRYADLAAYPGQKGEVALEILLVGQYRNGRGVAAVDAGDELGIEVIADQALGRRGLLALQNEGRMLLAQGRDEVAIAGLQVGLEANQRLAQFARCYPVDLVGDYLA